MSVSLAGAIAATGARVIGRPPDRLRICTDSRRIVPGETFVALRGPRFDGHAHAGQAARGGAVAAVVDDPDALAPGFPALVVPDTMAALQALAAAARNESRACIVGVTGSAGKTTTKTLLRQLIGQTLDAGVQATPANENNEIGVAKTLLALEPDTRFAVVEMGCRHFGDLLPLTAMARPDAGILTNIGDAHLEIMGSRDRLIETKFGLFATGASPLLNALDASSLERAAHLQLRPAWFAALDDTPAPAVGGPLTIVRPAAIEFHAAGEVQQFAVACGLPGAHNRANLAAALGAAWMLGARPADLAAAVPGLALPAGRYQRERIGDVEVIFDAYNASMSGTLATLDAFAQERAAHRIAVLGSMAELGADAPWMHRRVGAAAVAAGVDTLLVGGDFADDLEAGAREAGFDRERVVHFERNDDAVVWLREHAGRGAVVLLKASRRYRLEEIVEGLRSA
jgi:UDP-N-acetylmuramoyl-tripeptide--D-alanyl-D-alanine ligase